MGNVTIPANHSVPSVGAIVEVRYLYAHAGGSLVQPVYLGVRTDQDRTDCLLNKIKLKGTQSDDDSTTENGAQLDQEQELETASSVRVRNRP